MAKKDTNVSTMINNQLTNVQTTFVSFENFLRIASTADATPDTLKALERRIYEEEGKADEALRAMIDSLVTEILLPSTKKEMIDIGTSCDKIANKCESVATTMVLQGLRIPQAYAEDVMKIVEITEQQFSILCNVINTLFANFNLSKSFGMLIIGSLPCVKGGGSRERDGGIVNVSFSVKTIPHRLRRSSLYTREPFFVFIYDLSIFLTSTAFVGKNAKIRHISFEICRIFDKCPLG